MNAGVFVFLVEPRPVSLWSVTGWPVVLPIVGALVLAYLLR